MKNTYYRDHHFAIQILAGPLLFALTFLACRGFCAPPQAIAIGTAVWMGTWWILRPVDIAVTALLPIVINSFFNLVPMSGIISRYFSDIVVLLLGSDLISLTWETTHLDKRLAMRALCGIGASIKQQIFVWLLASTVLSIFLPNVVVVEIMVPVAIAMLAFLGEDNIRTSQIGIPIILAIVWGAGIGGFGSPLGGSANLVAIEYIEKFTGREFMYGDWIFRFLPFLVLIVGLNYFFLARIKLPVTELPGSKDYFRKSYAALGPVKRGEIIGFTLFFLAMLLAFLRPLYVDILPVMKPAYVFFFFGMLTFVLNDETGKPMLTWKRAQKNVSWGMMFLFAGGLALGKLITDTGTAAVIAEKITLLPLSGGLETMLVVTVFSCILTEISSNTAAAAISLPVVISTAQQLSVNPIPFMLVCIVAFNNAYMLPVSIRAIPCVTGFDPGHLLRYGLPLALSSMAVISVVGYLFMKFVPFYSSL